MEVLHEVPAELRRLVRLVARAFYSPELAIVVDTLIKHQCVREEALADHLQYERKQLRQYIAQMRQDRLVQTRLRMETGADGKSQRHNYYYINYKQFVNIVKYKLDFMRRKIETEERESTTRASFKCQGCDKLYTDLEADQLIDFATGEFRCRHCGQQVEEAEDNKLAENPQQLLVRFNEQIQPLFGLLRVVENVTLAQDILEPEPKELEVRKPGQPKQKPSNPNNAGEWTGDASRFHAPMVTFGENNATTTRETKEIPMWLQKSTVLPEDQSNFMQDKSAASLPTNQSKTLSAQDIMDLLLSHEKQPKPDGAKDSEEEEDDEWEEVAEEIPLVLVDGVRVAMHDITQELVDKMTIEERKQYIALAQQLHTAIYE